LPDSPDVLTVDRPDRTRVPDILRRTVPWVRLMSIILFIGSGLAALGGLLMALGAALGLGGPPGQQFGVLTGAVIGVCYAAIGAVNFFPAMFLTRFANNARDYATSAQPQLLEEALDAQRSYWKFMGVFTLIGVGLAIVGIVLGIVMAFWFLRR
jgi:hypothetical protein